MKTKTIQLRGTIRQIFPNATYKVEIDVPKKLEKSNKIDKEISQFCLCYLSGKITKRMSKPEIGDSVSFEVSPLDLTKGRIVFIHK